MKQSELDEYRDLRFIIVNLGERSPERGGVIWYTRLDPICNQLKKRYSILDKMINDEYKGENVR